VATPFNEAATMDDRTRLREKSGQEARSGTEVREPGEQRHHPTQSRSLTIAQTESPGKAGANAKTLARNLPALGVAGRAGLWL
jgi:hypothetical protein